jgi:hypothetical protein
MFVSYVREKWTFAKARVLEQPELVQPESILLGR